MRGRTKWVALLAAVVAGGVVVYSFSEPEPEYGGVSATRYACAYEEIQQGKLTQPGYQEICDAFASMEGARVYLKWIQYEEPGWQVKCLAVIEQAPPPLHKVAADVVEKSRGRMRLLETRRKTGLFAFQRLGARGAAALPELERVAANSRNQEIAVIAVRAMQAMGTVAVSPLGRVAANPHSMARVEALRAMVGGEAELDSELPLLISLLRDTNSAVAASALIGLGRCTRQPDLVIEAMSELLDRADNVVPDDAVGILATCGERARPILMKAQSHWSYSVRKAATNALVAIESPL